MINNTLPCNFTICYQPVNSLTLEKCIIKNDTVATINNLVPFTLYQFKVKSFHNDSKESSQFSNNIECYTSEDVPDAPDDIQGLIIDTKLKLTWKQPTKPNGVIQNYSISYTLDFNDPTIQYNITVPGDKTTLTLTDLIMNKKYFIIIRAATKAGYGRSSYPYTIFMSDNNISKSKTLSDKQQPPPSSPPIKTPTDQGLGIILGVGISIGFISASLCSVYCRKKWEKTRSMRETNQPPKKRSIDRNKNTCCIDDSSTSTGQPVNDPTINRNEFELSLLCPASRVATMSSPNPNAKVFNFFLNSFMFLFLI